MAEVDHQLLQIHLGDKVHLVGIDVSGAFFPVLEMQ
jgi:hypothetical protein